MKLKNENTDTEFVKRESDAHVSQNTVIATCQLTNSPTGPPQMMWKQLLGLVRCPMFDWPCRARTSRSTVDAFKSFEYARIVTFSECTTPTASSYLKHLWISDPFVVPLDCGADLLVSSAVKLARLSFDSSVSSPGGGIFQILITDNSFLYFYYLFFF